MTTKANKAPNYPHALHQSLASQIDLKKPILLSFSAGPDSVALAYLLKQTLPPSTHVTLLYFDHGLRSKDEINQERHFVRKWGKTWGCNTLIRRIPVQAIAKKYHLSLEMAGRHCRYRLLCHLSRLLKIEQVLTAHHQDDVLESVLLKLMRGTKVLSHPLPARSSLGCHTTLIRPLLKVPKAQLLALLAEKNIAYCQDTSNQNLRFKRNQVRHILQDPSKGIDADSVQHILDFTHYQDHLLQAFKQDIPPIHFEKKAAGFVIPRPKTQWRASYLLDTWIRFLFENCNNLLQQMHKKTPLAYSQFRFQTAHFEWVRQFIEKNTCGELSIAKGLVLSFEQTSIILKNKKKPNQSPNTFTFQPFSKHPTQRITLGCKHITAALHPVKAKQHFRSGKQHAYLAYDGHATLHLSGLKPGLRFQPFGMKQHKKVSDYLIDRKVDRHKRKKLSLFFLDNQLAWIEGCQISEGFKIEAPCKLAVKITIDDEH